MSLQQSEAEAPLILSSGPDHAFGSLRGHIVALWEGPPMITSVHAWGHHLRRACKSRPGATAYLAVIRPGLGLPDARTRELLMDVLRSVDGDLTACAIVVPSPGFQASAVRAVVNGIALEAKTKTPVRPLASLGDAHEWLAVHLKPHVSWMSYRELRETTALLECHLGHTTAMWW